MYELYDGEVLVVPAPLPRHQRVAMRIGEALGEYERHAGIVFCVPIDIVFDEHNVLQPDVVFFRHERRRVVNLDDVTRAVPDIAVEVLSPSTEARDRGRKMRVLERFGAPEYWLVDPIERLVEIYQLRDARYVLAAVCGLEDTVRSPTLGGLSFAAARVFEQ
jgi:Uma2 family endonuclease